MSAASNPVDAGRRARGEQVFREVMTFGPPCDDSPVSDGLVDFVFAEIWARPGLSRRDRRFVTLACGAAADADQPLEDHVYAALTSGDIGITEMRETVLHFAVYAGWPRASRFNGVVDQQWHKVCKERGQDVPPPEPLLPLPTASDPEQRLRAGEAAFREVNCVPYVPPRDNPYTGAGVLNFVFGEMWPRPGLGLRERRLISIACAAFQAAATPVNSQVYAALKSGDVSFAEMDEVVLHFAAYSGWPRASFLNAAVAEQKQRVLAESAGA